MTCPACGHRNMAGMDECARCQASLMQADLPQPDTAVRWRVMVDPISSLEPSTVEPQTVRLGTPLADAVRRMQERNVGYVLVVDGAGRLAGIFTEHDLLCRVVGKVSDLNSRAIEEFMTPDPTALHAGDPIKHALHFMAVNDFMYIPLVDAEGRPQDLLSFRRIARLIDQMD